MRAIVTILGKDRMGIMPLVCALLAQHNVNIPDVGQIILQGDFTMVTLVDAGACDIPFVELAALLGRGGEARSLDIHAQREDIFNAMYRIWGNAEGRRIGELRGHKEEKIGWAKLSGIFRGMAT